MAKPPRPATVTLAALLLLAACGADTPSPADAPTDTAAAPPASTAPELAPELAPDLAPDTTSGPDRVAAPLAWAIAGAWRSADEKQRDSARNPLETLTFFGVEPGDTVVELWPGGGWYSNILAPYLATGGGTLIAAGFDPEAYEGERRDRILSRLAEYEARYAAEPDLFGTVRLAALSGQSGPLAEPESADVVLTFRNLHNWMAGGYADKVFSDAFAVLKPGGTLGVVEHRLPSSQSQDPLASSGYVHEDYVRRAAERAGFVFVDSSEINANPEDTADHPFGVWTLPPNNRTEGPDGGTPEGFDPALYQAIGESDRMTLKFVKPLPEAAMPDADAEPADQPEP